MSFSHIRQVPFSKNSTYITSGVEEERARKEKKEKEEAWQRHEERRQQTELVPSAMVSSIKTAVQVQHPDGLLCGSALESVRRAGGASVPSPFSLVVAPRPLFSTHACPRVLQRSSSTALMIPAFIKQGKATFQRALRYGKGSGTCPG